MLKKILIVAMLFAGLAGCKSKNALKFSEDILAKENSLMPDIQATETKVGTFAASGQYDSIAAAGTYMEDLVQKKIDEIEAMSVPKAKEADNFKAAAIHYFQYIKKMYSGYKDWGNAQSDEEREKMLDEIRELISDKKKEIDNMQKAQKKFADANGFKLK